VSPKLPTVTVIMPVRNEQKHLAAAVESIYAQDYPLNIEVLLAVGPSVDDTALIAKKLEEKFNSLKVIDNPRGLTTAGLNLAISKASGNVIVRVDAHSELTPDYIKRGVEILREQKAVLVGGVMKAKGKSPLQSAIAFGYNSRVGLGGGSYHIGGKAGEAESAYLGIFDTAALRAVNGYDEGIIRGEDWDLAKRLKAAGGLVWFSPELQVNYWPRSSVQALAIQFYSTGVWRGELTRRAPGKASIRYFIPPVALLLMLDLAVFYLLGQLDVLFVILPAALYLMVLSVAAAFGKGLGVLARVMIFVALPTMHFSWALGFWIGLAFGARKTIDSGEKR
jgi:succinoglycan biosynthesis protein ExoA